MLSHGGNVIPNCFGTCHIDIKEVIEYDILAGMFINYETIFLNNCNIGNLFMQT